MKSIVLITGLVRSGKTTSLMEWVKMDSKRSGVLTPDIDGDRSFLLFPEREKVPMLWKEGKEDRLEIGKFVFSKKSFQKVNDFMEMLLETQKNGWIIFDEIGPLEIKGKGLYPSFKKVVEKRDEIGCRILVVVRSKMIDKVVKKFNLGPVELILKEDLKELV